MNTNDIMEEVVNEAQQYEKCQYICENIEGNLYIVMCLEDADVIHITEPLILSESAYFILKQLDSGRKSLRDLVAVVTEAYDIDYNTAFNDCYECLAYLTAANVVREV